MPLQTSWQLLKHGELSSKSRQIRLQWRQQQELQAQHEEAARVTGKFEGGCMIYETHFVGLTCMFWHCATVLCKTCKGVLLGWLSSCVFHRVC